MNEHGYRRYFQLGLGPMHFSRLRSWDRACYPRFGAWRHPRGFTLRFRSWLLVVSRG